MANAIQSDLQDMKLSIITINLNNANGLQRTVQRVRKQTFQDFEYIIIDGDSRDNSKTIIQNFEKTVREDPGCHLRLTWISESDNGRYSAMNRGIKIASGEYLLFLNSGDYLYNESVLEDIFSSDFQEDIISGAVETYSELNAERNVYYNFNPNTISLNSFLNASLNHQASFIRKSLFDRFGLYNENYQIVSDSEFFLKTIVLGKVPFRIIYDIISCFNIDGISSMQRQRRAKESAEMQRKVIPPLIYNDYKKNFISKMETVYRYPISKYSFKLLLYITRKYERWFVYRKK
jgi:glycosyltransferase involved in cell wall biosynthesis